MIHARKVVAIPPQSSELHHLLSISGPLNARAIGTKLGIVPNSVYRAIKPLLQLGMAEKLDTYPVSFRAVPANTAVAWYTRALAQSFRQEFSGNTAVKTDLTLPSMTFIKNREQLISIVEQELHQSKNSIDYIVSGHRVPDSNVLAIRKATTTGVSARCIIQNTPESTRYPLESYKDMGVDVRYLEDIGIRLFIFDKRSVIMTSYDISQSSKAFGIRFVYPPVATAMSELFEEKWRTARPL